MPPASVYLGDSLTVLGLDLGLLAKYYVGIDIALAGEQGFKYTASPPACVSGNTLVLVILDQSGFELGTNPASEGVQPLFVEHFDSLSIKVIKKSVRIVLHPGKQRPCGLVRVIVCALAGFDPTTKQVINQHAEIAARVVDLISFFMTSGDKGLEQAHCSFWLFLDDLLNVVHNILNIVNERPGGFVGDEFSGR
jgi:hypothetical protein